MLGAVAFLLSGVEMRGGLVSTEDEEIDLLPGASAELCLCILSASTLVWASFSSFAFASAVAFCLFEAITCWLPPCLL